ncbi:hypothetical protein NXF25_014631 [Crotalus adamanteus]|uniref:Uncharacterized protein n=1 Tax=Crotalus adamanteus TaxID=8729 RepID=A0AAW1AZ94_CROAD
MEDYLELGWAPCHFDLLDKLNLFFCKQITLFIAAMTGLQGSRGLWSSGNAHPIQPRKMRGIDWTQRGPSNSNQLPF